MYNWCCGYMSIPRRAGEGLLGIVTEIPHQNTTHIKTREKVDNNNNKMRDKYANSKRVDAAIVVI